MTGPRRGLFVVDVQNEYASGPLRIQHPPVEEALATIVQAMDAAAEAGIPAALVQHEAPAGAPIFAAGSPGWELHPAVAEREGLPRFAKRRASVFHAAGLADWVEAQKLDTVALVGFMSNNCVLATAADAETRGISVEVLRDATGAISLSNAAGTVPARELHDALMVLLHSNWARVATTADWRVAASERRALPAGNLVDSARG